MTDSNLYALWRENRPAAAALRETNGLPSERFLQQIWLHQRIVRNELVTSAGESVRIMHPGFWNHEAGPDFQRAVIQFGVESPRSGDVEIDLKPGGWRGHKHDQNPSYRNVILRVVWEAGGKLESTIPVISLKGLLDGTVDELADWLAGESDPPRNLSGKCAGPLRDLAVDVRHDLLRQAAQVRLQRKAALLTARARQVGWEQSLWEGLFGALGYKHNVWPMRVIAEALPRLGLGSSKKLALSQWQSRLFGVSGMLPGELDKRSSSGRYLRGLWDGWWREREQFADAILPAGMWRLHGVRPANHPQRRLALAAHWLAAEDLPGHLEHWFQNDAGESRQDGELLALLTPTNDDYWSKHWTLRSALMSASQPLLGASRVTDLAMNIILPWFWARAAAGGNTSFRSRAEQSYHGWPAGEDSAALKLARQRLLGGVKPKFPPTAAVQQGLLQITRDFCNHTNATCDDCRFPDLVRQLNQT